MYRIKASQIKYKFHLLVLSYHSQTFALLCLFLTLRVVSKWTTKERGASILNKNTQASGVTLGHHIQRWMEPAVSSSSGCYPLPDIWVILCLSSLDTMNHTERTHNTEAWGRIQSHTLTLSYTWTITTLNDGHRGAGQLIAITPHLNIKFHCAHII